MPEGNPLVADAKQDPNGPGPLTAGNGDYGWAGGIGLAESSMDAFNGIKDGDWVSGGLGVLSLAGEIAGAAVDPFGYLMSSVASFLMEHIQPLKDMLDSLAGNPPVIQSYADTWGNVSKALGERKTDFDNAVKTGTAGWQGAGADAYRKFATEHSDALSGAATVAGAISTVTMIMGQVVSFVRETVRQLIADLVGKLIAWVMEEVFSLGFGTPVVVAQASAAIAKWGKKIGELLKKLTDTIRKVSPLLSKLVDIFEKIAKVFGKVLGKVSGLDGLKIKEGGFVHKVPKGEGGVHTRAHGGSEGDSTHSGDSGDPGHADGDAPSSDPMNTGSSADPASRRSSSGDGSSSHAGDDSPSAHSGDGSPDGSPSSVRSDGSPSHAGDSGSPSHASDSSPSPTRAGDGSPSHAGDSSPSPTRGSDSTPSHARDSGSSPTRGADNTPSHVGDGSPSPTRGSSPSHAGDSSPSPTRGADNTPSHAGDSSPSPTRGSDGTPTHAGDSSPSPTRGGDNTPPHASDSSPSPTHGGDSAPSHANDSSPSPARGGDGGSPAHSGSSPAARADAAGPHGGTESPSSAAPPRADGATSASGTVPAAPRTGDPGTQFPSPRGGDGAAASGIPPQGGAPMGGGTPPGGSAGGLGGGSPRTGGGPGWTGTPGSPGARTPHVDAPGRPHTGGDLPEGRPRPGGDTPWPRTPEPAARGFGPGTHGPDTRPGARPGGPGHTGPGGPHENTPHDSTPHDNGPGHHDPDGGPTHHDEPLSPDEVNARHAESTPSGSSYHAGDPEMGDLPHRVPPDPDGRFTVDVHVTPDGHARIGDRLYTPEEFADVLRRNADYDGRPVRLIGCDASSNDFAHRLSRELDTEVMAPTKPAWTDAHGRVFSSDYEIGPDGRMRPRIPPDGEWNAHHPDGSTHAVGDDGFTPGTHDRSASADTARARGDEPGWQDRPGPDGRTPRENIADPEYIKKHYYRRPTEHGEELVINHRHANVDPPPPQLDLVDGEPRFKSDRPPAESLGFDESRSSTHPPQRDVTAEGHEPGTGHDHTPGEDAPGEVPDARNWRENDYDRIDDRVHDRQTAQEEYHDTPKDADDWVDKHNARNDASERLGEEASGHALRDRLHRDFSESFPGEDFDVRPHPDAPEGSHRYQIVDADGAVRAEISPRHPIDGGKPGAGNFDHIWEVDYKNGGEPHYIVHEAKGPGGQPSTHYDRARDRTFQQGHPEYFDYLVKRMEKTDPDLAEALERAKLQKRLDYVEVRARVDESVSPHTNLGYDYKPYNGYGYQSPLPAPPAE
ncbi:hypothetical protein VA596_03405 [Amycolatopsis sp., V23-08]|uniref:PPE-repeat protein n=1 Tax=Amycolatopsis heterodermiae TaxID=3110235 RepID=A0ABU5QXC4_9PSEU|nr:hypothetical protein [Amycolatopsis sp., V23-08]MEA5358571.1 hypothetical protein [Amycolatopsis sp., V23-08]